jgi:hypothetical protein
MGKSKQLLTERMWSIDDGYFDWLQFDDFVLESDSSKRLDLLALKNEDYVEAQKSKEALETIQRNDKKIREKNK